MPSQKFITNSVEETIQAGKAFAQTLSAGDVVCLHGDLGAGKTHFTKGISTFFGVDEHEVNSPTFVLIQEYSGDIPVYHFDAYRIESENEAKSLGTQEYFYGEGVCIIEWPEKMGTLIPDYAIHVTIEKTGESSRMIKVENTP